MRPALPLALCAALSACASFPEVDRAQATLAAPGAPPALIPLEEALAQAGTVRVTEAERARLAARAAALRARAAAMRAG